MPTRIPAVDFLKRRGWMLLPSSCLPRFWGWATPACGFFRLGRAALALDLNGQYVDFYKEPFQFSYLFFLNKNINLLSGVKLSVE